MLFYGDSSLLPILKSDTIVFNITSLNDSIPRLGVLAPNNLGRTFDRDFDIQYANYIMANDIVFCNFFSIVYNLYLNKDVYLVFSIDDWSENIAESLLKLIQQRYGYNGIRINNNDDYIYALLNMMPEFNHDFGLYNLDADKERYSYITESIRINNGGTVDTEV